MADWTAGYVADIGYTYGYYLELNPLRAQLAFLNAGLVPPESGVHCELGFGQGLSANIHAAGAASVWHGTDFNPAQAAFARGTAQASGANVCLTDEAFADFCQRSDLPEFDSMGLHGIWSWISDANRAVIVDFVRRKLKVGGVLYVSYNTLPGWAAFAPMRHLMTEHAQKMAAQGNGTVERVEGALAFAEKLMACGTGYAKVNPQVIERVKKLKEQDRHYLAHEYFNRDWQPMHFATMAQWLEPAKVSFACSAHYLDQIDAINLTAEQLTLLSEIPDPMFRQTVRDFIVNQQFRKDYWVKGARKLSLLEQSEAFRAQKVILVQRRADITPKVTGSIGEASLQEAVYKPILDFLADLKPKTLGQIEEAVKGQGVALAQITQAVMILAGAGHLAAVQDKGLTLKARKLTDKLNAYLIDKARGSSSIAYLASPVTGGGVGVNRFQQLFLLAISEGKERPKDWANSAWQILQSQAQKIVKEGQTLETPEENLAELTTQATAFAERQLAILKALQVY
jgi:SAM-dependent methyltransferase